MESLIEHARRVAIDACYHERDNGGTMHTAGAAAADAVLAVVIEHLRSIDYPSHKSGHPATWADYIERQAKT